MKGREHLAAMNMDLLVLERRGTVKPAYIKRRRTQLQELAAFLDEQEQQLEALNQELEAARRIKDESDRETRSLWIVLELLGLNPAKYIRRGKRDLLIYERAQQNVKRLRLVENRLGKPWRERWDYMSRVELVESALRHARLQVGIDELKETLSRIARRG